MTRLVVLQGMRLTTIGIVLGMLGALASYLPARRAVRIDPLAALRG